jgi:hypothetical protein
VNVLSLNCFIVFQIPRNVTVRRKGKLSAGASTSETPGSRFNSKYFAEVIAGLDDRKRDIIKARGFGVLLHYDGCSAARGFVRWIADQIDLNCYDIAVGGKLIQYSPLAVNLFLGIPIGGLDIKEHYNEKSTKREFLKAMKLESLPTVKTFGQMVKGNNLSDDDFFRCFMVLALSCFLCANSSTLPSPYYLCALIDVSNIEKWDWSSFVFDWLFKSIKNYRTKRRGTIGGCIYFLAVSDCYACAIFF